MESTLRYMVFADTRIQEALSYLGQKKDSCGADGVFLSELPSFWEVNSEAILKEIDRGDYEPGLVRITEIITREGKRRKISAFCSVDRLLLRCLDQYLQSALDPLLNRNCFAFRPDLGVTAAVKQAADFIRAGCEWEVRVDIRDFFDSIPLAPIEALLFEKLDPSLVKLLLRYLHLRVADDNEIRTLNQGLLQGSPLSPLLSNLYLTPLDNWLEEQGLPFCRYADDIIVCFRTRQEADAFYPILVHRLRDNFDLEINQKKSGVLETLRQQFLGCSFRIDRDGKTVIAYRTKHTQEDVYHDWRQGHIQKIDRHYHIVNDGILSKKDYNLLFESEEGKRYIPVETMGALNIYSDVIFSSDFFCFAAEKHLYISIFDKHGNLAGSFIPADNGYRSKTMLRQADIYLDPERRLRMAKAFELGAFHNLRVNLRYYSKVRRSDTLQGGVEALSGIIGEMEQSDNLEELMLLEARGRQIYYTMFNEIINEPAFAFTTRTRQPPMDPLNALISFGNTYLYQRVATEINKTALDIRVGFLHSTNKRSQSLNLDIAELFKPLIVDRAIFTLVNKKQIDAAEHFEPVENGGVYLNREGKRIFINELDSKVYQKQTENNRPVSYDTRIRSEVRKVLRFVSYGEEYKPYKYY